MKERLKKYLKDIWQTKSKRITFIAFIVMPLISNMLIEIFNTKSVIKGFTFPFRDPFAYINNVLIIMATMSIGLLLRKRLAFFCTVVTIWVVLGVINFVVTSKRTTPFSATDISLLDSIDNIIEKYLNPFGLIMIIIGISCVVVAVAVIWLKLPKYSEKINRGRNFILVLVMFGIMALTIKAGFSSGELSAKFPNMTIAYHDYGFPYCFAVSFNKGVDQPEAYSEDAVMKIVEKMEVLETVDKDSIQTPNVIFLQLESFFDVNKLLNLELSGEATPIFNQLKEEYPSGYLTVNNVGYGTANTEFEVMSGLNLDDFGPGEFPYKTILQDTTCESTGFILKDYGYTNHAIHNNTATFYGRNEVFKQLGFDTFTSVEYMNPQAYTPTEWVKDGVLADEIIKALNSTEEQDYIYTISVQGHGDYPSESVLEEPVIKVTGGIEDEERKYMLEYYVNMIYEMDQFVGRLIELLGNREEDTVLVLYGDHLPSLEITEDELENGNLYQTEYIVWNNIGLKMEDADIETYQLSSRVLQHLNIDSGTINKFHQTYQNDSDYLEKLHVLTFDILYGDMYAYNEINPYVATDMKMGSMDISITAINQAKKSHVLEYAGQSAYEKLADEHETAGTESEGSEPDSEEPQAGIDDKEQVAEDWYLIKGEYFTECSVVYKNDIACETIYIEPKMVLVYADELSSLDVFVVNQMKDSTILSSSAEYIYYDIKEIPENDAEAGYSS